MFPTPPPIEVVVGGASAAALRRAAELGDGWILPTQPLAGVPGELERLDAALDAAGRARERYRVFVPCLGAGAPAIAAVLSPVVSDITVMPWPHPGKEDTSVDEKVACLERWRDEVLAPLDSELAA
jgi:hypothetical protein